MFPFGNKFVSLIQGEGSNFQAESDENKFEFFWDDYDFQNQDIYI